MYFIVNYFILYGIAYIACRRQQHLFGTFSIKFRQKFIFMVEFLIYFEYFFSSIYEKKLLCVLRVIEGLCQGVVFPSTHTLLSKWAPVSERAQLGTYCYSGSQ